jgi:hypothetical protein
MTIIEEHISDILAGADQKAKRFFVSPNFGIWDF